jgi:hypothetical protein
VYQDVPESCDATRVVDAGVCFGEVATHLSENFTDCNEVAFDGSPEHSFFR